VVLEEEGGARAVKSWWTLLRAEWDRVAGVALLIGGGVAIFLGYRGVADSPFVSVQLPYIISGGFGGLVLCGVGAAFLVMADLHDEWRKLDRIEAAILDHWMDAPLGSPGPSSPGPSSPAPAAIDRPRAGLGVGLGLVVAVLAAGWERAAGSTRPAVGYQGVAVGSVAVVLTLAAATVLVVGRRSALARRRTALLGGWLTSREALPPLARDGRPDREPEQVLIAAASRRFHRPHCPTLAGLDAAAVRRDAVPRGLDPCGICGAT
jgi:hypothetical protein